VSWVSQKRFSVLQTQSPQIDPAIVAKNEKLRLKLKQAKDPVVKEKEDTARVKRIWQQMARRDIPKQHRAFTAALKKQTAEAKRVAELCQKEVRMGTCKARSCLIC
jgi:hypothetical protein